MNASRVCISCIPPAPALHSARAGRWFWPHDNRFPVRLRETADCAGIHCPTRRGARHRHLVCGGLDAEDTTAYATVVRNSRTVLAVAGRDIDLDRFQGSIGLFVPNTGYPFGDIPDWLVRQRIRPPDWYRPVLPLGYRQTTAL